MIFPENKSPCLERRPEHHGFFQVTIFLENKSPCWERRPEHHGFFQVAFSRKQKPLLGTLIRDGWLPCHHYGSCWDHFRFMLVSSWGHVGVMLGSLWGLLGSCYVGVMMGSCWGHFAPPPWRPRPWTITLQVEVAETHHFSSGSNNRKDPDGIPGGSRSGSRRETSQDLSVSSVKYDISCGGAGEDLAGQSLVPGSCLALNEYPH